MRHIAFLTAMFVPVMAVAQSANTPPAPPVQSVPATNYQQQGLGQTVLDLLKQVVALNAQVAELQDRLKAALAESDTLRASQHSDKPPSDNR